MRQDFFAFLPSEIIVDILSRLPILTILGCKFVCKSWLDQLESSEFADLHLPQSVPGLAVFQGPELSKPYKIYEFVEEEDLRRSAHFCNVVLEFKFPHFAHIHSSVNGLLFMYDQDTRSPASLFVCNPITRDYVTIPPPTECQLLDHTFGFGVSKMTDKYKLVKIFRLCSGSAPPDCEVYTIGTRSWRSIAAGTPLKYDGNIGAFLNGNLHWLAFDSKECPQISCFDVETELFSILACPPDRPHDLAYFCCFTVLGDNLCVCDNLEDMIVIWLMKDYGVEKSWTKEYVIKIPSYVRNQLGKFCGYRFPVKIFEDGDVLIAEEDSSELFCYSNKYKTIRESTDPAESCTYSRISTVFYTASFLSTKMFVTEEGSSF
ncbi:hypothetical protein C2S51_016448 [Perilla frutescens var. frutescens]|nr:hypothetical protein C2S51_016448 [Perilla frutescens var. frutescens]